MAKKTLNLGSILSQLLKDANANFTELYNAISTIQEKQADDGEKAVVYSTVAKMVSGLNAGTDELGNPLDITVGDEIYILDDDTPDFWVSAVSTSSSTGSKPTTWEKNTNYVFGKYTIRVSKSREIDLTQYQLITNLVTSLSSTSTDSTYPSAKAVYDAIVTLQNTLSTEIGKKVDTTTYNAKVANLESRISTAVSTANTAKTNAETANSEITKIKDGTTVVKKAEQDGSGNNIADVYATKEEVSSAISGVHSHDNKDVIDKFAETDGKVTYDGNELGKVQGVALNGTEITLDADGIANINVADLESVYITKDSEYWTTCPTNNLPALRVKATDTTLEMLNADGEAVVAQVVKYGDYLYYCVTETMTCSFRRIGGNTVGGSGGSDLSDLEERVSNLEIGKRQFNFSCSVDNVTAYSDEIFTPTVIEMEDMTFDGKTGVDAFIAKRGYMLDNQEDPEEGYVFYHYSGTGVTKTYLDAGETKTIEIFAGYWKITDRGYDIEYVSNLPNRLTEDLGNVKISGFFVYKSSDTRTDYNNLFLWLENESGFRPGMQNQTIENIGIRYCEYGSIPNMLTLIAIVIPYSGVDDSYVRFVYNNAKDDEFYFDISCSDIETKVIAIS